MTTTEKIAVCVNVCRILDANGSAVAADALREVADALRAGTPPHHDTARADAAEKVLVSLIGALEDLPLSRQEWNRIHSLCLGLDGWTKDRDIHKLRKRRDAARAEAARLDAELAAMGGTGS